MGTQNYSTVASRNLIRAEAQMLKHAEPFTVLGSFGMNKEQPKNKTDTIVFRRLNPWNMASNGAPQISANSFLLQEGVTPTPNTIGYTDVSVTLQQYGVLFKFSAKAEMMYEDNIPADMQKLTGETMAEVAEMIRYGVVRGGTSVTYANGSSRSAVNTAITLNKLRAIARTLETNRAKLVTDRLSPSANFGTTSVEPAFLVFCHTDCEADVRNLPGYKSIQDYGSFKPAHPREFGSCERFRFISAPNLNPFLAAGSDTINGMVSVGSANVDVYPMIVVGQEAWGQVALKGLGAVQATILSARTKSHANPLGQFGYVGGDFWLSAVRLNENWMVRFEAGVTAL